MRSLVWTTSMPRRPSWTSAATNTSMPHYTPLEEHERDDAVHEKDGAPPDHLHAAFIIMYLLGVGSLWSFNALITPTDYYATAFASTMIAETFLPLLTSTFTLTGLLTLVGLQQLQHLMSLRARILGSALLMASAFAVAALATGRALLIDDQQLTSMLTATANTTERCFCYAPLSPPSARESSWAH